MSRIRHTVTFKLKHEHDSSDEESFLKAAKDLAHLPTVQKFECLKEISQKNDFAFGLSMEFEDMKDYEAYNHDPSHVEFVKTRWVNEVADFIEIDYGL